jgi:exportin-2 (importin alpha re-exporter)
MGEEVEKYRNDPVRLRPYFMALRTMCRIFYSLNYQDLPEYFEDHMGEWMGQFSKYLEYVNPLLTDEEEENEASPIDTLQAAIVQNLYLYADKDEETFLPYLPDFTRSIWNLLMRMSQFPKHDNLATTCIRFLSSLLGKLMHKNLFQDENALRQIISSIVIPNIVIREIDQERFEDDPEEFIRSDMEENDSDSRRKCSQDLLRAMCRHFEAETTALCMENVNGMLAEFQNAPSQKWTSKDVAVGFV